MKTWVSKGNPNYLHLYSFLQAEIRASENKKEEANECFLKVISMSARLGFIVDFAHANERYAIFHSEIMNDRSSARYYMQEASTAMNETVLRPRLFIEEGISRSLWLRREWMRGVRGVHDAGTILFQKRSLSKVRDS